MKVRLALAAAAFAAVGVVPVFAADIPAPIYTKAPSAIVAQYDWNGLYLGVNVGGGVGRNRTEHTLAAAPGSNEQSNQSPLGAIGGVQAGYNRQFGAWLVGLETDLQGSGQRTDSTCDISCNPAFATAQHTQKIDWFGTTRARFGLATGPVLSYVTGGVAYGNVSASVIETGGGGTATASSSQTKVGWTIGSGLEASLGGNWTGKIEYLYLDFGSLGYSVNATAFGAQTVSTRVRDNIFRVGLNYNLNGSGAAPAARVANWSGFYAGGNAGYILGRNPSNYNNLTAGAGNINETFHVMPRGFEGGLQAGYNWQTGVWVVGVEADIQGTTARDKNACVTYCGTFFAGVATNQTLPWFGTVRGRIGYSAGPTLVYVTGGYAYGATRTTITTTNLPDVTTNDLSHIKGGYAVGGGMEHVFDVFGWFGKNWTSKVEYLFVDLGGSADVYTVTGFPQFFASQSREHIFRTGLNYHFNAPEIARN